MKKEIKLKGDHTEKKNVIPFQNEFNNVSAYDLENILEWLGDYGYLSDKGKVFRNRFWDLFIKKKK